MVKYDVCVDDGDDIGDDIFSLITHDMNNVRDYFDFKLTLNGMEQEIDDAAFSLPRDGSKGVCVQYNIVLDGCTTPLDFTAGVKLSPAGRIDSQEPCDGNDPFQSQQTQGGRQGRSSFAPAYHYLAFPNGVYDKTAATSGTAVENRSYIKNISSRCKVALTSTSTEGEILACNLASIDTESSITPWVFGPMHLSTNVLNAITESGYPKNSVYTPIFKPNVVAELISNSCIEYFGGILSITTKIYAYSDESSYASLVKSTDELDVSVEGSYAGVTGTAGYSESTEKTTAMTGFTSSAFGQRITEKTYATFENTCFTKENFALLKLQDTILPNVVDDWTFVRTYTGSMFELQKTAEFKQVAKGFLVPTTYAYTGFVGITMTTMFTSSTTASSTSVKTTMTASLEASYGAASASASTSMSKSNDDSLKTATSSSSSETVRFITGVGGDSSCLDEVGTGPCEIMINTQVSAIAADVSKQPLIPSKHIADVTIDDIVQGYFGDTKGLGPLFLAAVEDYYSYKICDKPGCPSSQFSIVTASGSKTKATMYDPDCAFNLLGGIGSDEKGVFCYDSCPNIRTLTFCLIGLAAYCPIQSVCTLGKKFLNPVYISENPGQVKMEKCQQLAPIYSPDPLKINEALITNFEKEFC